MKKLLIIFAFLALVPLAKVDATAYYVSFETDIVNGNGLATTTPFNNLDSFTEVARSAGDIAFVRRGYASTTNVTDLNFTSDGTIANPIIISADYDNLWNDFASSTQTYTVAVATSTFTASAAQSEIIVGEWVYVNGDCAETYNSTSLNQCEFAYEVSAVASTSISFYLPYKGNQTGAGHTLRILSQTTLGSNPQWNVATGDFQWNFDTDNFWLVKGIDIRGTDVNGSVEIDSSDGTFFEDILFTGDGSTAVCVFFTDDGSNTIFKKIRCSGYGVGNSGFNQSADTYGTLTVQDSIIDGNGVGDRFLPTANPTLAFVNRFIRDSFIGGNTQDDIGIAGAGTKNIYRNVILRSSDEVKTFTTSPSSLFFENHDGNILSSQQNSIGAGVNINTILLQSTTTSPVIRSGGGATSIQTIPTTNTTSIWDFNKIKLFEYPIYTNTTSKTYTMYAMSTSTAAWTTDPTASEFWLQCEYWAHDTNATSTRKIKKSTGVFDFNGSTAWQSINVTCQPSQTGINYVSAWYAKTKEAGMNEVFMCLLILQ